MSNSTPLYFADVLDKQRQDLLPLLVFFKERGFFLGGGTALSLIFGHRESIDFDFFVDQDLDVEMLFTDCLTLFAGHKVIKIFDSKNTLYLTVDGVKFSFFSYHYPSIDTPIASSYMTLYSLKDIAAMKLRAIQNRATLKDYVDLYYIIKELGLDTTLATFVQKFGPVVAESYLLKSLIYFDDITAEPLVLRDTTLSVDSIQQQLKKWVIEYSKQ